MTAENFKTSIGSKITDFPSLIGDYLSYEIMIRFWLFIKYVSPKTIKKFRMVPKIPNKPINLNLWKNSDFFIENPAAKIIGGKITFRKY